MTNEKQKMWALYKITNLENNKIYIGQTVQPDKRWNQHRSDSSKLKYPLHFAIHKYGAHKFDFEVIAYCKSQDDANWAEEELIKQYDCLARNGKGYNISLGGMVAPKSEEWKQAMKNWHASLSPEDREEISKKQSKATQIQIATKGHPAQGTKRTPEQSARLSQARKDHPVEYTPEIRKKMSEAHIGKIIPEEQRKKMAAGVQANWDKRNAERFATGEIKCNAPGCEISGKAKYKIIEGVRYCNKHGLRLLNTGFLELQPRSSHNKGVPMSEEAKEKVRLTKLANKISL